MVVEREGQEVRDPPLEMEGEGVRVNSDLCACFCSCLILMASSFTGLGMKVMSAPSFTSRPIHQSLLNFYTGERTNALAAAHNTRPNSESVLQGLSYLTYGKEL